MSSIALSLADEGKPTLAPPAPWRVLVVDDDRDVHNVTRLSFTGFEYQGRGLTMLSAHSAAEAREVLRSNDDIALALVDVVMETDQAGLELTHWIREQLGNRIVRIVLRTGQPGQAPARDVVHRYEIDDYRTKTELTFERLHVLTVTALRTYAVLHAQAQRERQLALYNEEIERFAHAASHDLQTPLRTLVRYAQRLQDKYQAQLAGVGGEYLDYVVGASRDLHRIIDGLLAYTSIGHGAHVPGPVALGEAMEEAAAHLRDVIDARGVRLDCGPLPTVTGQREQLVEVFRQLIDNAIKFQPGESPVVSVAAARAGENWEVRIADRGIGIDARHLGRIFERHPRLNAPDAFPGSGIGLAICRKVLQLHGGSLHAQSAAGGGTIMMLTLPGN
ncbi:MAG TPA: ATP-binding protein [Verrucomicrobiae bacterium]|nr:ATP-binding protein [Verrucomicrobiae bacterium]